ncbi:enoyl-CoA hydratase-related protein [Pseudonocardia sp. RS11V-5]|uniref:enoyl-CoA hydratase/isomerase family protein n=1 Tax=Pseudonocardia terrae TaxID=2905831 RepID=UPI001E54C0BC|nr:enoyl-CoA hydratase-related protein [Pseudonocardia terrae]MCE3551104.1 enoyl-CoA hydratase-related protein [Pseudonocardia terrae]
MVHIDLTDEEQRLKKRIVLSERRGHVLVVTMNRPERRNALGRVMRQGLREAFDEFEADPELRCAVLTGDGPVFSAGGDLKEMAESAMRVPPPDSDIMISSRGSVSKPVVAAVNGPALAGGFRLVQDCDLAVASEQARFAITEVLRGRGAPWAAPLIDIVPKRIMAELLLTGEPIGARRAYEVGLVNAVVPAESLLEAAVDLAQRIAAAAPLSVRAAKTLVGLCTEMGTTQAERCADIAYERVYTSNDAQEGPRAFAEKRAPVWTGK